MFKGIECSIIARIRKDYMKYGLTTKELSQKYNVPIKDMENIIEHIILIEQYTNDMNNKLLMQLQD